MTQAFGVFVEPANGEYPFGIAHETDDIVLDVCFGGGGDACRLVEYQVYAFVFFGGSHDAAIHLNGVARFIPVAWNSGSIVQQYPTGGDQVVCFPATTIAGVTNKLV